MATSWKVGDLVTLEPRAAKPKKFRVAAVDDSRPGFITYTMQCLDGSAMYERQTWIPG